MLSGLPTMQQASIGDGLSLDPFPFDEDGLATFEVDVGRCQVAQALMVSQVIVVGDEGSDLGFEVPWQVVVFEQDAVLCPSSEFLGQRAGSFKGGSGPSAW